MKRGTDDLIARITKSHSAEIRIRLTSWRGSHKIELRESTSNIPGIFFPTPHGVTLDVTLIPELLKAISAAEAEAKRKGLLK